MLTFDKKSHELNFSDLWAIASKAMNNKAGFCDFSVGGHYYMLRRVNEGVMLYSMTSETLHEQPVHHPDEYAIMQLLTKVF